MGKQVSVVDPLICPVCGHTARSEEERAEHFELKKDDAQHQEYMIGPEDRSGEIIDEDTVGAEADTPGHPGIDEGTTD